MKQLAAAEKKKEVNPNVLDAMNMLKQSWSMVTQEPSQIVTDTVAFLMKIPMMIFPLPDLKSPTMISR